MKKGQISVFIIIAVLILGVIGGYFILKDRGLDLGKEIIDPEVQPIYSFVENCIYETGENAVERIGETGGYFASVDDSLENGIAYYLYEGENYMPSKEEVEEELSIYINEMLFFCISGFNDFPDFEVEEGEIETLTKIEDESVVFDVEYKLNVTKGERTYSFKNFEVKISVRLGVVYNVIENIMVEQMTHSDSICLGCVADLGLENNLNIDILDIEEGTIFSVVDESSKINNENFIFSFANKYDSIDIW